MITTIEAKEIHKTYGKGTNAYEAVKGVNLAVKKGEAIAILGKSGSGKSTLMHLLAGLDKPTNGSILYQGKPLTKLREKQMAAFRNHNVGFVFQQFFLQPTLTVLENVEMPLKIAGISRKVRRTKACEALEKVDLLDKANNRATNLSGGQKQRAAIARALVATPEILFADEPTGNLDTETGQQVIKLLFDLREQEGITLILVTHDEDLAKLCDRQIKIKDGKIA